MDADKLTPLGQNPIGPSVKDIDPVAFALERVQTHLVWIDEHRRWLRGRPWVGPGDRRARAAALGPLHRGARKHMARLVELVLAGYTIDPSKLPRGLSSRA